MQKIVWYNRNVPSITEKKSVQIAVKLPESLYTTIEAICAGEDRPVGYVARELMIRGLALYRLDGKLRDEWKPGVPSASTVHLAPVVASISPPIDPKDAIRRMINDDELAEAERRTRPKRKTG